MLYNSSNQSLRNMYLPLIHCLLILAIDSFRTSLTPLCATLPAQIDTPVIKQNPCWSQMQCLLLLLGALQ